jgi:cation transport protein ChaC
VSGVTSPPELKPDLASLAGVALTREALNDDALRARLQAYLPAGTRLFTDEEHRAGIDAMLSERDAAEDVWVFAYGSLIWNPVVDHVERRAGTINGFHRRFCLWAPLGRGTPKQPSLTLGLDRGGRCRGVAFRIEAARAREELLLLWRREMLTGAYVPRWIDVATATQPVRAVTFVINRGHRGYAGRLPEADVSCDGARLSRHQRRISRPHHRGACGVWHRRSGTEAVAAARQGLRARACDRCNQDD